MVVNLIIFALTLCTVPVRIDKENYALFAFFLCVCIVNTICGIYVYFIDVEYIGDPNSNYTVGMLIALEVMNKSLQLLINFVVFRNMIKMAT